MPCAHCIRACLFLCPAWHTLTSPLSHRFRTATFYLSFPPTNGKRMQRCCKQYLAAAIGDIPILAHFTQHKQLNMHNTSSWSLGFYLYFARLGPISLFPFYLQIDDTNTQTNTQRTQTKMRQNKPSTQQRGIESWPENLKPTLSARK